MQNRIYITATSLNEYRELAWHGAAAYASFEQLRRMLASRLSPEHSALFAQPLPDDVRRRADWYFLPPKVVGTLDSPGFFHAEEDRLTQNQAQNQDFSHSWAASPNQPVRLVDLPPQAQAPIREKLILLGRDIYALSQELKNSPDSNQHTAGNLLEMALTFPGEEFIYVIGNTPVLTAWGFTSGMGAAQPEMLTRLRPLPASMLAGVTAANTAGSSSTVDTDMRTPVHEETRIHRFFLPWALLAFLLGALICLLLLYIFTLPEFGFGGCARQPVIAYNATEEQTPSKDLLSAQAQEYAMRAELERLRQELLGRLAQCIPVDSLPDAVPLETVPAEPDTTPETEIPPIPDFALPDIEDSPNESVPDPATEFQQEQPQENTPPIAEENNLEIPEEPEGVEFLEGCWNAPTGLINVDNGQPVIVEYCFDGAGDGRIKITEIDRSGSPTHVCEGPARAQMNGNQLSIQDGGAICPDKNNYYGNRVICYKDGKGNTVCKGHTQGGQGNEWGPVPFSGNK